MPQNVQNIAESTISELLASSRAWMKADSSWGRGLETEVRAIPRRVLIFSRDDLGGLRTQVHQRLVWMVLLAGEGGVLIDHRLHSLRPGQSVLVLPYQGHYRSLPIGQAVWLLVAFELDETAWVEPLRNRVFPADVLLHERLAALLAAASEASASDVPLHLALALQRMLVLTRLIPTRTASGGDRPGATDDDGQTPPAMRLVRRLTQCITEQLETPLRVEALCDQLDVSESTLRSAVRRAFDLTPQQLILQVKMHRAAQMLSLEGASVQETAYRLGFASPYTFSRAFRRVMRRTARSYKKQLKTVSLCNRRYHNNAQASCNIAR